MSIRKRLMRRGALMILVCALLAIVGSCRVASRDASRVGDASGGRKDARGLCVSLRSAPEEFVNQSGALAAITERFGGEGIDAIAGGGFGAVSAFLYDSVVANPLVGDCRNCDEAARVNRQRRVSLLLKSVKYFWDEIQNAPLVTALESVTPIVMRAQTGIGQWDLAKVAENPAEVQASVQMIRERLFACGDKEFIDQEFRDSLGMSNMTRPYLPAAMNARSDHRSIQAYRAALSFALGALAVEPASFLRPGLLNTRELATRVGVLADFLAQSGVVASAASREAMGAYLDACAASTGGMAANRVSVFRPSTVDVTCGQLFKRAYGAFTANLDWARVRADLEVPDNPSGTRLKVPVGTGVGALVVDAVLAGPGVVDRFEAYRERFMGALVPVARLPVGAESFRIGYWGRVSDLDGLAAASNGKNAKATRFMSLGSVTWLEALERTLALPGLGRGRLLTVGDQRVVSLGGWADDEPVGALRAIGCATIIHVAVENATSALRDASLSAIGVDPDEFVPAIRDAYRDMDALMCAPDRIIGERAYVPNPLTRMELLSLRGYSAPIYASAKSMGADRVRRSAPSVPPLAAAPAGCLPAISNQSVAPSGNSGQWIGDDEPAFDPGVPR